VFLRGILLQRFDCDYRIKKMNFYLQLDREIDELYVLRLMTRYIARGS